MPTQTELFAPATEQLAQAQFAQWPDSLILTPAAFYQFASLYVSPEEQDRLDAIWQATPIADRPLADLQAHNRLHYLRMRLYQSGFFALTRYPGGIFYACHKDAQGRYQHVGYRYGVEASQYLSGFTL